MGVTYTMYTCVKMDATLPTVIRNMKILIKFVFIFETSLDISLKHVMS